MLRPIVFGNSDVASILHVINDVDYWLHHRRALAVAAIEAGYTVGLAAPPHQRSHDIEALGIAFYPIALERFRPGFDDLTLFNSLRSLFGRGRFDLVHAMTIKPLLWGGLAAATLPRAGRPALVGTVAGLGRAFDYEGVRRWLLLKALAAGLGKTANIITFENPIDASAYTESGIIDPERVRVLKGAGVDLDIYRPAKSQRGAPIRLLFASRLLKAKGILAYRDAARLLKQRYGASVVFSVAGISADNEPDGLSDGELEELQNDPCLNWLGAVPGESMAEVLRDHDIFVLPTSYPEGLPRSLLEAGACGLAVIAGDVPGTRALIEDTVEGILLPENSAACVAAAMDKLICRPNLRLRLAERLRTKIETEGFSLKDVNKAYLACYAHTLGDHSKR